MKFFRNNWYWIFSIVIGLGIGSIITMHRVQQQTGEPEHISPDVAKPSISEAPGETSHGTPNVEAPRNHRPIRFNRAARDNPSLKNIGSIPAADHDDIIEPPPLPTDLQTRLDDLHREMAAIGEVWEIRNGRKFMTEEAHKRRLGVLAGDMNPEEAIDFLEKHGQYNEAILSQVSADRAFKYLKAIRAHWKRINEYAEKALVENPDNFEAKMKLMLYEKDNAKAAAGYREILVKDPNHVGALISLSYRTHYEDPEGALAHAIKANKLDPTYGLYGIAQAYERLGDVKTAWLYYRKHLKIWPRDMMAEAHLGRIDKGDPVYPPIHLERQMFPQRDKISMDKGLAVPPKKPTPAEQERPWYPELPPEATHLEDTPPIDAAAARAAFQREFERQQAAAQKEFNAFMKWAETVKEAGAEMDTNDFLTKELASHLSGGKTKVTPERLVRAFELMERHGRTSGLQRLKDKDPELAAEMQRFLEEKQQPSRRNNQQNKNE